MDSVSIGAPPPSDANSWGSAQTGRHFRPPRNLNLPHVPMLAARIASPISGTTMIWASSCGPRRSRVARPAPFSGETAETAEPAIPELFSVAPAPRALHRHQVHVLALSQAVMDGLSHRSTLRRSSGSNKCGQRTAGPRPSLQVPSGVDRGKDECPCGRPSRRKSCRRHL